MESGFATVGGIMYDDIIRNDIEIANSILGGSGLYAVYGMKLGLIQNQKDNEMFASVIAKVGEDFDMKRLNQDGIETSGIKVLLSKKTVHAAQRFDFEGIRHHTWVSDFNEFVTQFRLQVEDIPIEVSSKVTCYHTDRSVSDAEKMILALRERNANLIVYEPSGPSFQPKNLNIFQQLIPMVEIFSPNLDEMCSLLNFEKSKITPESVLKEIIQWKAQQIVLRMGTNGSLCYSPQSINQENDFTITYYHVPCFNVDCIDETGAGNAFCGALLVNFKCNNDLLESTISATVCASLVVEQFGPPIISDVEKIRTNLKIRREVVQKNVKKMTLKLK